MNDIIHGILLINKPKGISSNYVLQKIKKIYNIRKIGHSGCLDPIATGMLAICIGKATKFSKYIINSDKCYQATGLLGIETNTQDSYGDVVNQSKSFKIKKKK